jgi:hypothetical protein
MCRVNESSDFGIAAEWHLLPGMALGTGGVCMISRLVISKGAQKEICGGKYCHMLVNRHGLWIDNWIC